MNKIVGVLEKIELKLKIAKFRVNIHILCIIKIAQNFSRPSNVSMWCVMRINE